MDKLEWHKKIFDYIDLLTNAELVTLMAFWNYVDNKTLTAYPSIKMLAENIGKSERTVQRALASLLEKGFLGVVRAGGNGAKDTTERRLTLPEERQSLSPLTKNKGDSQCHPSQDNKGDSQRRIRVTFSDNKGDSQCHPNRSMNKSRIDHGGGAQATPATPEPTKQPQRGTRLPDHFKLDQATIGWTLNQPNPHKINPNNEYEKFCDYWKAKPGKAGIKLDWNATWRNWWRKALEYAQQDNKHNSGYKNQNQLMQEMFTNAELFDNQQIPDINPLTALTDKRTA